MPAFPRIIANFAMSLDGKISTRLRVPSSFTSANDKHRLRKIRASGDAVLVGRKTAETDSMSLCLNDAALQNDRIRRGLPAQPLRAIVSGNGAISPSCKVFSSPGSDILLFSSSAMPEAKQSAFREIPGLSLFTPTAFSLAATLEILLSQFGAKTVVCEGGPTLFRSLLALGAIDELYLTVAPFLVGGSDAPTLTGSSPDFLNEPTQFSLLEATGKEDEIFLHYRRKLP